MHFCLKTKDLTVGDKNLKTFFFEIKLFPMTFLPFFASKMSTFFYVFCLFLKILGWGC